MSSFAIAICAVAVICLQTVALSVLPSSVPPFQLQRIDHVVLRCRDMNSMFDFYTRVLGCTVDRPEDVGRFHGALTHLRAGDAYVDLLAYDLPSEEGEEAVLKMHGGGRGYEGTSTKEIDFSAGSSTMDHLCIRVEPFDEANIRDFFAKAGVKVISSGQRKGADGVGPAVYVEDPEGNVVELKGPPGEISTDHFRADVSQRQALNSGQSDHVIYVAGKKQGTDAGEGESDSPEPPQDALSSQDLPSTPCVRICRYNAAFYGGQVCIGCYREPYEIGKWSGMTTAEKSLALLDAADRCPDGECFEGAISQPELLRQARAWGAKR